MIISSMSLGECAGRTADPRLADQDDLEVEMVTLGYGLEDCASKRRERKQVMRQESQRRVSLRNKSSLPISPHCPVVDRNVPASARDELCSFNGRKDRHRVLIQNIARPCQGLPVSKRARDQSHVHCSEIIDLASHLWWQIVQFCTHDAAQAHAVVIGERGAKDFGVSIHAPFGDPGI